MAEAAPPPGPVFRWTRRALGLLAGVTALAFIVTTSGLYFWFNLGGEDRCRFEYGRLVWRHHETPSASGSGGLDGGASRVEWGLETSRGGTHRVVKIPLWMPFLLFVGLAVGMTLVQRWRDLANRRRAHLSAPAPRT